MSTSVNSNPNPVKTIGKGAVIGAGVGAATQAGLIAAVYSGMKTPSKDEFLKNGIENAKRLTKDETQQASAIEYVKENADKLYQDGKDIIAKAKKEIMKKVPANILKSAGFVAVIGAAIGGIVYLVKKAKANKAQNAQQSQQA